MYGSNWYHFLVWSNYNHRPCNFEKSLCILRLFFNSWSFSYGYDGTQTQRLLILRRKPNHFCHTDAIFPSWNLRLLNSSLNVSMIHMCGRFSSVVISGVSNQQEKQWMDFHSMIMWSNHSFHHWRIFTIQNLLLSMCSFQFLARKNKF